MTQDFNVFTDDADDADGISQLYSSADDAKRPGPGRNEGEEAAQAARAEWLRHKAGCPICSGTDAGWCSTGYELRRRAVELRNRPKQGTSGGSDAISAPLSGAEGQRPAAYGLEGPEHPPPATADPDHGGRSVEEWEKAYREARDAWERHKAGCRICKGDECGLCFTGDGLHLRWAQVWLKKPPDAPT